MKKALAALVLVALACGKRGDPRPPIPIIPQATSDLVVTQRADRVILTWSYPALTTAGKSLTDVDRITIYRQIEELPVAPGGRDPKTLMPGDVDTTEPQPIILFSKIPTVPKAQFVKLSQKLDSIEKANLASATAGAKLFYTDTPQFRTTDGRPVRLTYALVTEGGTARSEYSNMATIVPLPVAVPPAGLAVQAKAEGVTLTWAEPKKAVDGSDAPIVRGYNVYRSAPGAEPNELEVAINTAPVQGTTFTDTPSYGEHQYRVSAVAAPGVESDPSAPASANFRDLVPPPAPASVTPLVESNAVRLLWDPVQAADLAGYRIYRTEGIGHTDIREAGTIPVVQQPITETTYLHTPVSAGLQFRYSVTAVDRSGNESARTYADWIVVPKTP